jgi:hypothetical protein
VAVVRVNTIMECGDWLARRGAMATMSRELQPTLGSVPRHHAVVTIEHAFAGRVGCCVNQQEWVAPAQCAAGSGTQEERATDQRLKR